MYVLAELYEALYRNAETSEPGSGGTGLFNASVTGWKKGSVPRDSTLSRIADYFGVPVESLTADDTPSVSPSAPSASDESQLLAYFRQFNREGKGRILDFAESMERSGKYAADMNRFA